MPQSAFPYAIATCLPLPFLAIGVFQGGWVIWFVLFYISILIAVLDEFFLAPPLEGNVSHPLRGDVLLWTLALAHFTLVFLGIWSLAGGAVRLFSLDGIGLFTALGLFIGQVSNSNAHELIHRPARSLRQLGRWIYISMLFGHHATAHTSVHHIHVATRSDPNSARLNEGFYRFFGRAWFGSYNAGLRVEQHRLASKSLPPWHHTNPYITYIIGAAFMLIGSFLLAGWRGVAVHLALAGFAQIQLLLSDYVQHYGLERHKRDTGKYAPVAPHHSWNAPHWLSALWMLGAPRHGDHHARPDKPFFSLENPACAKAPTLPYSLPVMACIALVPPLWRKVMNPLADQWRGIAPNPQS